MSIDGTSWRRRRASVVLAALALLTAPSLLLAQPDDDAPQVKPPKPAPAAVAPAPKVDVPLSELEPLLTMLNSKVLAERESATSKLRADDRLTFHQLERLLLDPARTWSLESRTRLISVARERFMLTERAALGFRFGGNLTGRVVVGETYPKFPAHGVLELGDMIIEADGTPVDGRGGTSAMQAIIVSRDPGDTLPLLIRRGKQKILLPVKLGRYADLDQMGFGNMQGPAKPNQDLLDRSWRVRARALAGVRPAPLSFEVDQAYFSRDMRQQRQDMVIKRLQVGDDRPMAAGGGMPRLDAALAPDNFNAMVTMNPRIRQIRVVQAFGGIVDQDMDWTQGRLTPAEELRNLAVAKAQAQGELAALGDTEEFGPKDNRLGLREQALKRLKMIDRQREAVEAEITERGGSVPDVSTPEPIEHDDPEGH